MSAQKHDRTGALGERLRLLWADSRNGARILECRDHDRKRFGFTMLPSAQTLDGLVVGRVDCQVKSSHPSQRDDPSIP